LAVRLVNHPSAGSWARQLLSRRPATLPDQREPVEIGDRHVQTGERLEARNGEVSSEA